MLDLRSIVEPLVTVVGVVLILAGALAIVLNLIADILKVFKQNASQLNEVSGIGDWIQKLPERYLVPTVVLLLGILLADPVLFSQYGDAIFGSTSQS